MRHKRLLGIAFAMALVIAGAVRAASPGPTNDARYVSMPDGVRIAIDIWLPAKRTGRIPTLVRSTRYWRAIGLSDPSLTDANAEEAGAVTAASYALVLVDVRGSGASFGTWPHPWSRTEVGDLGRVVDWIVRQPWSNGRVGSYGISYEGNTAELLGSTGRNAVRAVAPRFDDYEPYAGIAYPGGIFTDRFVRTWNDANQLLDVNDARGLGFPSTVTGVKPVDGPRGRALLREAVSQHGRNGDTYQLGKRVVYRDDPFGSSRIAQWSPSTYVGRLGRSGVAVQAWASWLDAGTADGALSRYVSARNPQSVLIGAWSHGAGYDSDPFKPQATPVEPDQLAQFRSMLGFFDRYLKRSGASGPSRQIRYYTLGAGDWHTTTVWPPRGIARQSWYLGPNNVLIPEKSQATTGADRYRVDFTATTGTRNRWHTQAGGADVVYGNRADEDRKLLTYTSTPLPANLEVTGHPVVTLRVQSTAADGAFFVYLEDVAPDGRVTYVTEGQLRALHRKVSKRRPPYRVFGPYHSFERADGKQLVPGQTAELRFALLPTSALLKKGHRIRVAIAGADSDTFAQIPARGNPVVTVLRSARDPSRIELPVRRS
jgi:uncharacterized protein